MVADPYLMKRLEAIELELAELRARLVEKRRPARRKLRGSMKGVVDIEDVKRVRRELFGA